MDKLYTLLLVVLSLNAFPQKTINVPTAKDEDTKSILIGEEIDESIIPNKPYKIKIYNVNSAHTILKIKANSKEIYTPIPEMLKSILPSIQGSVLNRGSMGLANLENLIKEKYERLIKIKDIADKLHSETLFEPKLDTAKRKYIEACKVYNKNISEGDAKKKGDFESIREEVSNDIQYLYAIKAIADVERQEKPEYNLAQLYASIATINNELIKNDYLKRFDYLYYSMSAEKYVVSKVFSGDKDLVELNMILIDTYAKDTLANEMRTLYTKGGSTVGLSFSTGFFYTHVFSDTPYYLKARPDENVAVLPDERVKYDISIGALGHLYYKVSPVVRFGPSLGIAISPFDAKTRYLLGGSLLLGRERMIGITVGSAWAKVKSLSAAVSIDEQGMYLPKGATTIPTYDRIRSGWFFGITYNLASTRK